MAKIAFILLCHKDPEAIVHQALQLTAVGDYIAIHFDASAPKEAFALIEKELGDNPNVAFAKKRIKCGWGEWSLVQATLHAVEAAVDAFPRATHFYMVSGDCMAIKSASHAKSLLDADDCDYIESFDFFEPGFPKWPRDLGLSALLFVVHFSMLTGARGWIHGTPCRCGF